MEKFAFFLIVSGECESAINKSIKKGENDQLRQEHQQFRLDSFASCFKLKDWITKYLFFVTNFCFYARMCDQFEESLIRAKFPDMHNYLKW